MDWTDAKLALGWCKHVWRSTSRLLILGLILFAVSATCLLAMNEQAPKEPTATRQVKWNDLVEDKKDPTPRFRYFTPMQDQVLTVLMVVNGSSILLLMAGFLLTLHRYDPSREWRWTTRTASIEIDGIALDFESAVSIIKSAAAVTGKRCPPLDGFKPQMAQVGSKQGASICAELSCANVPTVDTAHEGRLDYGAPRQQFDGHVRIVIPTALTQNFLNRQSAA